MADEHSIQLSIDLEIDDAEKSAKKLQEAIRGIFKSHAGDESASLANLEIQMKKNYDAAENLREKLYELSHAEPTPTNEYIELSKQIDEVGHSFDELLNKREALQDEGMIHPSDKRLALLNEQIEEVGARYDELIAQQEAMEASGMAFLPIEASEEYQKLQNQLDITNDKLKQEIIRYYEIADAQQLALQRGEERATRAEEQSQRRQELESMKANRQEMAALNRGTMAFSGTIRGLRGILPPMLATATMRMSWLLRGVNRLTHMTKQDLVMAINSVKTAIQGVLNVFKSHPIILIITAIIALITIIVKITKKLIEKLKEALEAIEESLKQIWEYVSPIFKAAGDFVRVTLKEAILGFSKLGTLFGRTLVKGIISVIDKLKQMKSLLTENIKLMAKWNDGVNDINKSMSNLTSSLAYLKATITAALVPVLTAIEPILTFVLDHLADAINLVGMFIAKITGATHYQQAIRKQKDYAESLGKVGDAASEASDKLASFDKLNVLGKDKNGNSNELAVDFKLIELKDTQLPNWFDDLEELGKKVSKTISRILKKIPWKDIKKKATDAARAVADFINGLNFDKGPLGIGSTIGEGFNTIVDSVNAFLDRLDGESVGIRISRELKDMISYIDFSEIGKMFSGSLNELADMLKGFADDFDSNHLALKISGFLSNALGGIQWNEKVIPAMKGLISDFVDFLNGIITPNNLALIGTTLKNTLVSVITGINLFANKADWKTWGESLADGIMAFFEDPNIFANTAKAIGNLVSGIIDMLETAMNKLLEGDNLQRIIDSILNFFENIPWMELAQRATEISQKIREGLKSVWDELKKSGAYRDLISTIVSFINEIGNWKDLVEGIKADVIADVFQKKNETIIGKIVKGIIIFAENLLNTTAIGQIIKSYFLRASNAINNLADSGEYGYISPQMKKQIRYEIEHVPIPGYASGAVIPPSMSAHLAVLGDNNKETEVVSPLSTMKQALGEVLAEQNINVTFQVEGDPNGIFNVVQKEARSYNKRTGSLAFGGA